MSFENHQLKLITAAHPLGVRKSLADWGITQCTVTTAHLMGDEIKFLVPVDALASTPALLADGDKVLFYDPLGVCRFAGYAKAPELIVNAQEQARSYTVSGGDWLLARVPYQQHWRVPKDIPTAFVTPATEMREPLVSLVTLFRSYSDGSKVDLWHQLKDALDQAVTFCTGKSRPFSYGLDGIPNGLNAFDDKTNVQPPEDEKRDRMVLDVLEAGLLWVPYVFARYEYSSGDPVLAFSSAPSIETSGPLDVPGTLIPGGGVEGAGFVAHTCDISELTGAAPVPMSDRLVSKVTINYLYEAIQDIGDGQKVLYHDIQSDVSTVANGAFPEMVVSVPLRSMIDTGLGYDIPEPRPADGLARALHQAYAQLWWKFGIEYTDESPRWDYQIGEGWKVTGLGETMPQAVAQRIVRDIATGKTRIETGPPSHLGYEEMSALLLANKLRTIPGQRTGAQQFGFSHDEKKKQIETDPKYAFFGSSAGALASWYMPAEPR